MGLYEADFSLWALGQAHLLREQSREGLDWNYLAEELENMSARERRELASRLRILWLHLLKWEFQPNRRGQSWRFSIEEQIDQIRDLLKLSPSLTHYLPELLTESYSRARRAAAQETGLALTTFPEENPFNGREILEKGFFESNPL